MEIGSPRKKVDDTTSNAKNIVRESASHFLKDPDKGQLNHFR